MIDDHQSFVGGGFIAAGPTTCGFPLGYSFLPASSAPGNVVV